MPPKKNNSPRAKYTSISSSSSSSNSSSRSRSPPDRQKYASADIRSSQRERSRSPKSPRKLYPLSTSNTGLVVMGTPAQSSLFVRRRIAVENERNVFNALNNLKIRTPNDQKRGYNR